MKITKRILKQLIREELLHEDAASDQARAAELARRAGAPGKEVNWEHPGLAGISRELRGDTEEDPLHTPKELGSLSTMTGPMRRQKEMELKDLQAKLKKHQGYLAAAEQYLAKLNPRAIARPRVEEKIAQLRQSISWLTDDETSLVRDLDLGKLEWPESDSAPRGKDYMYPPRGPSSPTPAGKPFGRRFPGLEEQTRITKKMLKQLIKEEYDHILKEVKR